MLDEQDRLKLRQAFSLWPERLTAYSHPETEPDFTKRVERLGASTRDSVERGHLDPADLRRFLVEVGYWKMPRQRASHEGNVSKNSDLDIQKRFAALAQASSDKERIEICIGLWGFGKGTKQTRMASAILRFLSPEKYGVIDWRNWAVLSNCDHMFLCRPLLRSIGGSRNDLRHAVYDVAMFLEYLDVLRAIRKDLSFDRVSDVDLAVYSYSTEIWPFPRLEESLWAGLESRLTDSGQRQLPLHKIYETYWEEWKCLDGVPLDVQKDLKLAFLLRCLQITPRDIMVRDEATCMKVPYYVKHKRDLEGLERKILKMPAKQAVDELDGFMWNMRLKGDGYGVI